MKNTVWNDSGAVDPPPWHWPAGHQALLAWLTRQGCAPAATLCCLEQTGVYADQLLAALTDAGWPCALEKTTVTQRVRPEHPYKTDAVDAAHFQDRLTRYTPPHAVQTELRVLLTERGIGGCGSDRPPSRSNSKPRIRRPPPRPWAPYRRNTWPGWTSRS